MVKCVFSLGIIDKKLILPLLTTINYIIYILYSNKYPEDDVEILFYSFGVSIGEAITFFVPYLFKYENNDKTKDDNKKCQKTISLIIFF